jgi:hypothetical protein
VAGSTKEKSNKKENKGMGYAHKYFDGVFLGIGIKTGGNRDLNETYYLYSSSGHVFFEVSSWCIPNCRIGAP